MLSSVLVGCRDGSPTAEDSRFGQHPGLDAVIEEQIVTDFFNQFVKPYDQEGVSVDNVYIGKFYGVFENVYVFTILVEGYGIGNTVWTETVAGITFSYEVWIPIRVWFEGSFFTLTQSYQQSLLTVTDLQQIEYVHKN